MKQRRIVATVVVFFLCAAGIIAIAFWPADAGWPFNEKKNREQHRTRIIVPSATGDADEVSEWNEYSAYEDSYSLKAPPEDDEIAISVLTLDLDNDAIEEQIVAFRSLNDAANPVSIAFLGYDEQLNKYRYLWNIPTAATMPGTVSLYTHDLLGDRSFCVIITGMNGQGEHTMTAFRKDPQQEMSQPFNKIAEITVDGSIIVQETERPLAYQQGISRGQPFVIAAWGRDAESTNVLDRIEISYSYNPASGQYEQSKMTRVPGSQIEQRRLKEILTGEPKVFEEFINDLWYHVNSQGIIDKNQYLYFDPAEREIIFFDDDTEQIFIWQTSTSRYYGLYITTRNIAVTTLRRFLDIEMVSLDRIRMRVNEDVRLKINISTSWDGLYQRAGIDTQDEEKKTVSSYTTAVYDSSMGRLRFHGNGEYELSSSGTLTKGRYAFFKVGSSDLLELRPERTPGAPGGAHGGAKSGREESRFIYNLTSMENPDNLSLSPVRLGPSGVQELHETPIILTKAQ